MFCPSMQMVPLSCFSSPATMRRVVVFPAPVGPSRTKNSPCAKEKDTSWSAVTVGKRFVMLRQLDLAHLAASRRTAASVRGLKNLTSSVSIVEAHPGAHGEAGLPVAA